MKALLALSICVIVSDITKAQMSCTKSRCSVEDTSLRFTLVGDFGGLPWIPFYTTAEHNVATQVASCSALNKTHFNVGLGDNFYYFGVENEHDTRFTKTFEQVFANDGKPWYIIAGNHDHYGNVTGELAYSAHSSRWVFPSLYYTVQYTFGTSNVDFIMIDTVELCGNTRDLKFAKNTNEVFSIAEHDPYGPTDRLAAEEQWTFVEAQLKASTADYLFVIGHYPVWSISSHGPTICLTQRLDPLLHQYNVSAFISGHDHTLQHFITKGASKSMNYIVTGAGCKSDVNTKHLHDVPTGSLMFHWPNDVKDNHENGGFVYMNIGSEELQFSFIRDTGDVIYKNMISKRNQ